MFLRVFAVIFFIALSGCNSTSSDEPTENKETLQKKRIQAAQYNVQLGLAYLDQGDRPRAKRKLLKAIRLNDRSAEAFGAMAFYLEKSGDIDGAKRQYQRAITLAPREGAPLNNYGAFLCRAGNYKEANIYFMQAVHDMHYINTSSAYENAGLCAEASKNRVMARQYFIQALAHDPRRKTALYALTNLAIKSGEAAVALNDLKTYHTTVLEDKSLLNLGIELAQQLHEPATLAAYRERLNAISEQKL